MARLTKPKQSAPDKDGPTPQQILGAFLEEHKEEHLNFVEEVEYKVSTGSVIWDIESNGGLTPGLHRFIGPPESGKSSAALEVCRNFLAPTGRRGLYIKAEGKLPREMRERCGLKFVWNYEEWVDGTIFVLESNHYEFIINLLRRLVIVPETTTLYCVIFDSMDGLILSGDVQKESGIGNKVAGAPKLTKEFLQKMGNEMGRRGHMVMMLSQYSTNIALDPYAGASEKRCKQGGGGWAAAHWAHFVFEFGESFNADLIKEDEKLPPSVTNKILGKRVKVTFKKSPNEKTGVKIDYPIKYGVIGGSSIWKQLEVVDYLKQYSLVKGSTWITFDENLRQEAKAAGIEIPEQFNGSKKLLAFFEADEKATDFLSEKFKKIAEQKSPQHEVEAAGF